MPSVKTAGLSTTADAVIPEYGTTEPIDHDELPDRAPRVIDTEINDGTERVQIEWLPDGRFKLHATSYVGIITLPGDYTVEIRPKARETDLLALLRYSQGIRAKTIAEETSIREGNEFIHALATLFEAELDDVLTRGLASEYRRKSGTEDHVRGRIAVHRQLQRQGPQPTKFECNYDSLTEDTVLNQSILYATDLLLRLVDDRAVSDRLHRHKQVLQRSTTLRPVRVVELEQVELSRLAAYYGDLFRLTKLIISGIYADELTAGSRGSFSLLVNMNEIFEKILERGLSDTFAESSIQIRTQVSTSNLLRDGSRRITIRPDILAEADGVAKFVGDAKWKLDDQRSREPSNEDLYQLLSYQVAYEVPGVLFYPAQGGTISSTFDSKFDHDIHIVEVPTKPAAGLSFAETVERTLRENVPLKA